MAKKVRWLRHVLYPLFSIPFVYWGISWYEQGFSMMTAIFGAVLVFILLPVLIVMWGRK